MFLLFQFGVLLTLFFFCILSRVYRYGHSVGYNQPVRFWSLHGGTRDGPNVIRNLSRGPAVQVGGRVHPRTQAGLSSNRSIIPAESVGALVFLTSQQCIMLLYVHHPQMLVAKIVAKLSWNKYRYRSQAKHGQMDLSMRIVGKLMQNNKETAFRPFFLYNWRFFPLQRAHSLASSWSHDIQQ